MGLGIAVDLYYVLGVFYCLLWAVTCLTVRQGIRKMHRRFSALYYKISAELFVFLVPGLSGFEFLYIYCLSSTSGILNYLLKRWGFKRSSATKTKEPKDFRNWMCVSTMRRWDTCQILLRKTEKRTVCQATDQLWAMQLMKHLNATPDKHPDRSHKSIDIDISI